jgi:CelD/BcsL family acetyltransferase involved in cellulose biosynthesis
MATGKRFGCWMRLEVLDSVDALERFRSEWSRFLETIDALTPFQLPEWLLSWWRHFGGGDPSKTAHNAHRSGCALRAFVFRADDVIAGVIPAFLHEWNGRKQLTLIGSGISDYLEPAIAPERRCELVDELRRYLKQTDDWEICDWQDLEAGTPLAGLTGLAHAQDDTPCSEIKLTGAFAEYWAKRGHDLRRNVRRYGARADKMAKSEFAVTANHQLTEDLIRLHGARWQKRGEAGTIAVNRSAEFLCDVTRDFARLDMLRVFNVRFRGEVVAISAGFLYRSNLYSYLSAFDPQYEILGFGRKLLYESLRYAYEQHYTAWNFCRGEEPYKFSFGAERIRKCRLMLTRAHLDTN